MLSWKLNPSLAVMPCERAWVEVDLTALADNVRQIKRLLSPATELMAIVKADAYGHGAVPIARTVLQHGASWLGVATIFEGIELREAGIQAPILLLGATNTPEQVRAIAHWQLQPTLCTPQQAQMFSKTLATVNCSLPVHLKIDTGMSRLGVPWQQAIELVQLINHLPHLRVASVYSHLATADSSDPRTMYLQQSRYQEVMACLQKLGSPLPRLHLANSAATLSDPSMHYDLVRVGLAIYGLYPASHLQDKVNLKPVLQVKARVTQVKTIQPGTGVSYGHLYVANRETRLAVVGIGYADGIPRGLSNRMNVLVRGQRIPQIGAITMDQLMLDVSKIPDLRESEVVTLIGQDGAEQISVDNWATMLDTIAWEVLCGFKHRLPRVPVGNSCSLN
ncbi:MAG: alanine racemase [Elainella sp. C42_A2020_010]|nr:alanine racemase [Elainella sp. C42_A2020_010]